MVAPAVIDMDAPEELSRSITTGTSKNPKPDLFAAINEASTDPFSRRAVKPKRFTKIFSVYAFDAYEDKLISPMFSKVPFKCLPALE